MKEELKQHIESLLGEKIMYFPGFSGKVETESGKIYFLKQGGFSTTYRCEANGLKELAKPDAFEVARPIAYGDSYILTEFIQPGKSPRTFFEDFGKQLARLHRYKGEKNGFYENNFIGANVQLNLPYKEEDENWILFYFNKRLLFQYKLAERKRLVSNELRNGFSKLGNRLDTILQGSEETPSLLHGDLWSGNFICNEQGNPVLIDPAVYYGHREADLAMTKLFGGFPSMFYESYQKEYPLAEGWEYRENLYKLYHVLNHLNLFGRSYLYEAEQIVAFYTR